MTGRLKGYLRDPLARHATDRKAGALLRAAEPPPKSFDGDDSSLPVLDQDHQDCVANQAAQTIQLVAKRHLGLDIALPSRRAIYALARAEVGDLLEDSGSYISSAWDAIARLGFADEALWPYDDAPLPTHDGRMKPRWQCLPGAMWFSAAVPNLGKMGVDYLRVTEQGAALKDAAMRAVSSGYGLNLGLPVTDAFENQDGRSPLPAPRFDELVLGEHALEVLSYDEHGVRGRSSWGRSFGDDGRYYVSWDYFLLASDPLVIKAVHVGGAS